MVNVVIHSFYILVLPVWYFLSVFSAPNVGQSWNLAVCYYALKLYPYAVIVIIAWAWVFYEKGFYKWTYPLNAIPAVPIILCTVLMAGHIG
ncbi:hypothetical protein J34TS1_31800 [Paenibacillus azoreducens]|uniref:Uncharacterized protein n=1 Tax=Paenibacillus azoreducens TaxID=116718 RepID=A0A920CRM5_9BACL|nr:hypothetical protein J34TS1_31800 [Paenibacillus azoreducens]